MAIAGGIGCDHSKRAREEATLIIGAKYSACKHFPEMQKDFDCPLCKAELEVARTSTLVCVSVDKETGTVTFDSEK